jgi:hypothetical protein
VHSRLKCTIKGYLVAKRKKIKQENKARE